jgi:hypothetical protein
LFEKVFQSGLVIESPASKLQESTLFLTLYKSKLLHFKLYPTFSTRKIRLTGWLCHYYLPSFLEHIPCDTCKITINLSLPKFLVIDTCTSRLILSGCHRLEQDIWTYLLKSYRLGRGKNTSPRDSVFEV